MVDLPLIQISFFGNIRISTRFQVISRKFRRHRLDLKNRKVDISAPAKFLEDLVGVDIISESNFIFGSDFFVEGAFPRTVGPGENPDAFLARFTFQYRSNGV